MASPPLSQVAGLHRLIGSGSCNARNLRVGCRLQRQRNKILPASLAVRNVGVDADSSNGERSSSTAGRKPSSVVEYLLSIGLQESSIQAAAAEAPELLALDVEKGLLPAYRSLFDLPDAPVGVAEQLKIVAALHELAELGMAGGKFNVKLNAVGSARAMALASPTSRGVPAAAASQQQAVALEIKAALVHGRAVMSLSAEGRLAQLPDLVQHQLKPLFRVMRAGSLPKASMDSVARAWSCHPGLFTSSFLLEACTTVEELRSMGLGNAVLATFVAGLHPATGGGVSADTTTKLGFLEGQLGLSRAQVTQLLQDDPAMFNLSLERHYKPIGQYLRAWLDSLGLGQKDGHPGLPGVLFANPDLLGWDVNDLDELVYFLGELIQDGKPLVSALHLPNSVPMLCEIRTQHCELLEAGMEPSDAAPVMRIRFFAWLRQAAATAAGPGEAD